jgi:hypothetical protein
MDWKYKHFNQEAVFKAPSQDNPAAARLTAAESLELVTDTAEGFIARGYLAWHPAIATFILTSTGNETRVAVELLVERAAIRAYMLVDAGGYYNSQIDKWFSGIAQRLGGAQAQALVSKTTSNYQVRQGLLTGCLVYLIVGACLGIAGFALDHNLSPRSSGSITGPFGILASGIGLLAGIAAFLYVMNPDSAVAKFSREGQQSARNKERQ